jgi:putative spermidine/putrescine transport system ATP-binding protein
MQIEIKRLQRQSGITTILVTHDQEEALGMSDRIAVLSRGDLEQFGTPADIYDRPASVFVNTFVGSTNLLPGQVLDVSAGGTTVRLDLGSVVATTLSTPSKAGSRVLLSVRPEAIRLVAADGESGLPGIVQAVMPIGAMLIYQVLLADRTVVKVVQDRSHALPFMVQDSAVSLSIDPHRASGIFPETIH